MAHISHFDDFMLVRILALVPLSDLIQTRLVCKKWCTLIEKEIAPKRTALQLFRSVAARAEYRRLVAVDGLENSLHQKCDTLIIHKLSINCGHFLMRLFPRVEQLFFHFTQKSYEAFHLFLTHWKGSLRLLTVYFGSLENSPMQFHFRLIWQCLQSLSHEPDFALRHLALSSSDHIGTFPPGPFQPISTLERLSLFRFGEEEMDKLLQEQVGENITQLDIEEATITVSVLEDCFKSKAFLKTNLTHLTLNCYDWDNEKGTSDDALELVANNCTAITNLDITIKPQFHIEMVSAQLKRFPRLTKLTLRSENKFIFSDIEPTEDNHDLMMPSITDLELHLRIKLDKLKLLPIFFPSVRQLQVDFGFITCRCVSRQMERTLVAPFASAICANCYKQAIDYLNEEMPVIEKLSSRNLQIRELNNLPQ